MKAEPYIEGRLVLAIDFDGTITNEPDMGEVMTLRANVQKVLWALYGAGVRMQLWTCRTGNGLEEAMSFLIEHGLLHCFETINDHLPEVKKKYGEPARKLGADFYIDDKNLGFTVDWLEIEKTLIEGGYVPYDHGC